MAERLTQRMTPERYAECLGGDDVDPVDLFKIAMAQAHAEGLEAARRAVCQYPGTDDEHPCPPCQRIRALAGQPSGDAKPAAPEEGT